MKNRTPLKNNTSSTTFRRSMTERRSALKNQIRKSKRNNVISLKRRLTTTTATTTPSKSTTTTTTTMPIGGGGGEFPTVKNSTPYYTPQQQQQEAINHPESHHLLSIVQSTLIQPTPQSLSTLQSTLSTLSSTTPIDNLLNDSSSSLSTSTAMALSQTLATALTLTTEASLDASRIITNLAAAERTPREDSYYGSEEHLRAIDVGWCGVFLRSNVISALIAVVLRGFEEGDDDDDDKLTLVEQCCWALGNLAGDSQRVRDVLRERNVIEALVGVLRRGCERGVVLSRQTEATASYCLVGLCRNAAWALSNMARGGDTSALPFLAVAVVDHQNKTKTTTTAAAAGLGVSVREAVVLLTLHELAYGREAPELMPNDVRLRRPIDITDETAMTRTTNNNAKTEAMLEDASSIQSSSAVIELSTTCTTWLDVSKEICWMFAFITAREDAAVDYLCHVDSSFSSSSSSSSSFIAAVSLRLSKAVASSSSTTTTTSIVSVGIPCLRIIGNVATACDGRHVPQLLFMKDDDKGKDIVSSLAMLLERAAKVVGGGGCRGNDVVDVAMEAAWAAGALLCDAGPDSHPSTKACHELIPPLCHIITGHCSKLDLKRETLRALWNAVSPPPHEQQQQEQQQQTQYYDMSPSSNNDDNSLVNRNRLLLTMARTAHMMQHLVAITLLPDVDATHIALRLIDAMIRRLPSSRNNNNNIPNNDLTSSIDIITTFEECRGLEALDAVCDRASSSVVAYGRKQGWDDLQEASADIAANLIDDFFDDGGDYMMER